MGSFALGARVGVGSFYYHNYRQKQKEQDYYRILQDFDLLGKKVKATSISQ